MDIIKQKATKNPTLEVEGFLNLESIVVEQKQLTVLIGPQASGKSLISKLFFFFQDFLSNDFTGSFEEDKTKRNLITEAREKFRKYFDPTSWSQQNFKISYFVGPFVITVCNTPSKGEQRKLKIDYSENLDKLHRSIRNGVKRQKEKFDTSESRRRPPLSIVISRYVSKRITEAGQRYVFAPVLFIPAGRSFFSSLKEYVFSFLARDIGIDPFLSEFGSSYELARRYFNRNFLPPTLPSASKKRGSNFDAAVEEIISGSFKTDKENDWIDNGSYRVKVSNASSGQQEAVPLLLVLRLVRQGYFQALHGRKVTVFIEEPEAHLFPTAQDQMARIFGSLLAEGTSIFMTTHSPYFLSSLNVMILKHDAGTSNLDPKLHKDIPSVPFETVSAYGVNKGNTKSILDTEFRIIGSSELDRASEVIDERFEALI